MVKNDWTNITWPISVIHVNATIQTPWRVFWTYSNCARLLQSIPDTVSRSGRKPEVFFALFPMCSSCFPGGFWQSETGLVDYSQCPIWRQQTGNSYAVYKCKLETWFFYWYLLPRHVQCGSVKKLGWAIIVEITKITHISVVYWPISKRSTVPRPASGPLAYSKMAVMNPNSPRVDCPRSRPWALCCAAPSSFYYYNYYYYLQVT